MLIDTKKDNNLTIKASIDIGSNSIRMLIAKVSDGKIVDMLRSERATTRLASGINETGALSADSIEKSLSVLSYFKSIIVEYSITDIRIYATSAVREASNGDIFIAGAKKLGIDVNVINGDQEAYLVYLGVCAGLDVGEYPMVFDTGGGSTEIIAVKNGVVTSTQSHKIGVVKLVDKFNLGDERANIEGCKAYVKDFFQSIVFSCGAKKLIATAGTATTLAAIDKQLEVYDWQKINGHILQKERIEQIFDMLINIPISERHNIKGMDKGREDLIIAGIIIMLEIMKKTNFLELTVADFGLREGALVYS